MGKLTLDIKKLLHAGQYEVYKGLRRFTIVCAGRRWGKTRLACIILIIVALHNKGIYWWIAPTYKIADIGWALFKGIVRPLRAQIKEGDRKAILSNGSEIHFKSADNPDNLRGEGLKGVIFDEAAFTKESVWISIIRPALADNQGWAIFISTPNGKNWFYNLTLQAEDDENWIVFTKPTSDNPYIPAEELEAAQLTTPEYIFKQEYLAEFIDDNLSVFRGITKASTLSREATALLLGLTRESECYFTMLVPVRKIDLVVVMIV